MATVAVLDLVRQATHHRPHTLQLRQLSTLGNTITDMRTGWQRRGSVCLPPLAQLRVCACVCTPSCRQVIGVAVAMCFVVLCWCRVAGGAQAAAHRQDVDEELLVEKENTIQELQETIEVPFPCAAVLDALPIILYSRHTATHLWPRSGQIMELKIKKLEQLVRLKDSRIQTLTARIKSQQMSL